MDTDADRFGVVDADGTYRIKTVPLKFLSNGKAVFTASAVPKSFFCITTFIPGLKNFLSWSCLCPNTAIASFIRKSLTKSRTYKSIGLAQIGCKTLGMLDFIRVPSPAARIITAVFLFGVFIVFL